MSQAPAPDSYRVSIHADTRTIDLCLPADVPVALLVPQVVDLLDTTQPTEATEWTLAGVTGSPMTPTRTLRELDIADGDTLLLGPTGSAPSAPAIDDAATELATALQTQTTWTATATRLAGHAAAGWCAALAAAALLLGSGGHRSATAVCAAALACAGAAMAARGHDRSPTATTLGCCATVLGAAAGYLAVPGDVAAAKLVLAGAVAATLAVLALCITPGGTTVLTAIAGAAALTSAAACAHVLLRLPPAATGALLATTALAMFAGTGRLTMWAARIPAPQLIGPTAGPPAPARIGDRAAHADAVLAGLVCAFGAAAALGSVLAVIDGGARGSALAAVVGSAMLMRSRTPAGLLPTAALVVAGTAALSATYLHTVLTWPGHGVPLALAAVLAGSTLLRLGRRPGPAAYSPVVGRWVDAAERTLLGVSVPLGCWAGGLYDAVRGLTLT